MATDDVQDFLVELGVGFVNGSGNFEYGNNPREAYDDYAAECIDMSKEDAE